MLGKVVGNYRVTRQIGEGGMGAVYEAEHVLLGKRVAIKVLLPERSVDKEIVDRFFNEAKASTMVHHPGIVEIFDYGHLDTGSAYIVMEYLDGESLGQRLRRTSPLSATNAVSIARHIAGTLSAAHAHGIVHRDLKPDNIHLVPDPALPRGERAKILDFGIAKLAGKSETGMVKTDTGRVMGTPMYMSPEQCRGSGKVDHRSDIYALGCVFYHMLVGRPPFIAEGSGEILAAHIHVQPQPPSVYQPTIPPQVEEVVMRLLRKDREERYQNMDEVIVALNDVSQVLLEGNEDFDASLAASRHFQPLGSKSTNDALAPTTLGMGASQSINRLSEPNKSLWLSVGIGVVALSVIAVFAVRALRAGDEPAKTPAASDVTMAAQPSNAAADTGDTATEPDPGPMEAPVDPSLDAPQNTPAQEKVTLTINSEPSGAKVYRVFDGVMIGRTPFNYEVLRGNGEGEAEFILKNSGYRSQPFSMVVDEDNEVTLELRKRRHGEPELAEKVSAKGKSDSAGDSGDSGDSGDDNADSAPRGADTGDTGAEKPEPKKKNKPGKDDALDPFATKAKTKAPEPKPEEATE